MTHIAELITHIENVTFCVTVAIVILAAAAWLHGTISNATTSITSNAEGGDEC